MMKILLTNIIPTGAKIAPIIPSPPIRPAPAPLQLQKHTQNAYQSKQKQ